MPSLILHLDGWDKLAISCHLLGGGSWNNPEPADMSCGDGSFLKWASHLIVDKFVRQVLLYCFRVLDGTA